MRHVWLCDVNGVLIDSAHLVREAFAATAARYSRELNERQLRQANGRCLPEAYRLLDPGCDATSRCRYHLDFITERLFDVRACPGVRKGLEAARAAGIRVGAATSYGRIAEACLVNTGLYDLIDHLVTQEEVRHPKPSPEILFRLLELFAHGGDAPLEAAYIGDTPVDVEAGKAAGVTTIGVTYGLSNVSEMRRARPDYLIHSFDEMRQMLKPTAAAETACPIR